MHPKNTVINPSELRTGPSTKLITSDLAGVVCQLITSHLVAVFGQPSGMANRFTSSFIRTGLLCALLLACSWAGHAADFSLEDMQGKTHRLADYRGKWVLVNFWATWCPPCLKEIPELISLHNAHQDKDLSVIGIAMDSGSSGKVADFAQAHGISYPVVMGNRKIAAQIGAVEVLPVSYLYNPNGERVGYQAGEVTRANVEAYIKKK
jgi:thiol-disulfide isomerase/thioredoxin